MVIQHKSLSVSNHIRRAITFKKINNSAKLVETWEVTNNIVLNNDERYFVSIQLAIKNVQHSQRVVYSSASCCCKKYQPGYNKC